MAESDAYAVGIQIREDMFGPKDAQQKVDAATDFTHDFEILVTEFCFGDIWGRDGLGRDVRSMITLAMLIALGRPHEIRVHVEGAIANGVTKEQIREVILHSAAYCGIPAAVDGFRQAIEVLDALGVE